MFADTELHTERALIAIMDSSSRSMPGTDCRLAPQAVAQQRDYLKSIPKWLSYSEAWGQLQKLLDGELFTCNHKEDKEVKLMTVKLLPSCSALSLQPMDTTMSSSAESDHGGASAAVSETVRGKDSNQNRNLDGRDNGGQLWSLDQLQVT